MDSFSPSAEVASRDRLRMAAPRTLTTPSSGTVLPSELHLTETPHRVILEAFLKQVTNDACAVARALQSLRCPARSGKKRPVTFDTGRPFLYS